MKGEIDLNDLIYKGLEFKAEETNEDERAIIFRITTPRQDEMGDIVEVAGADLSYYRKHPIFLWAHDHSIPAIGRSMWIKKDADNQDIKIKVQFQDTTQFAKEIYELYKQKYLQGCSIGLQPKKVENIEEDENGDKIITGRRFKKWTLIEVSACNSPANREAIAVAKSIVTTDRLKKELEFEVETKEEKAVGGKRDLPLAPEDRKWDATRAEKSVRRWAGGEKDKIDWDKYRQAFIWYDPEDKENFRAYKLPFAEVLGGSLKAVWRGIAAGMAALLGARGGVDIPGGEKRSVYNFLSSYYKRFDKEPPEFKEYSEDEIEDLISEYELEEDEFNPIDYEEEEADKEIIEKPYPNEHSCRLQMPNKYDRFVRKNCARKSDGKCIDHVYGIKEGKSELQALRYKKDIWTESDAKAHCKDEKGFFEPAEKSQVAIEGKLKELVNDWFKEMGKFLTGLDARVKKMEATIFEKTKPEEKEDMIEIIDDKKEKPKEDKKSGDNKLSATEETYTFAQAKEIVEKAIPEVISRALDYMSGRSFVSKKSNK